MQPRDGAQASAMEGTTANNDHPAQRSKYAFITGITGQDGSYLAELLLEKGYIVYGMIRRSSSFNLGRLKNIRQNKGLVSTPIAVFLRSAIPFRSEIVLAGQRAVRQGALSLHSFFPLSSRARNATPMCSLPDIKLLRPPPISCPW